MKNTEKLVNRARVQVQVATYNSPFITPMMLTEIEGQYIDMANGGDGSCVGNGEIRERYYSGEPDEFFQLVCDGMGWVWRQHE